MAINKLHFSDLKDGCCKKTVASQLQRFWDARNLKKVSEHLGLDLVFLDNKVSENEQLMVLANTNVDFPDVFGDVCGIKTTFTMRIRPFNVLWLYGSDDGSSSKASKYGSVKKIERVTLAELNNYVLNSPPQSASESLQQAALPRCIQDIIVQNLTFQLKLFEIHFSSTVVRIFYTRHCPHVPNFLE
ncbi:unnamed protein product [Brassica rapa]|uniref:Uncharacterized protein n=1 Tax=Brassica campestris TaxID=3711 RepID=A0A8D9G1W9_BRACM|nr:unnamed protein product [Brassica rapa]